VTAAADQEPTYACRFCCDRGWRHVPCGGSHPSQIHAKVRSRCDGCEVLTPCRGCDRGMAIAAGYWYGRLYEIGRGGKPFLRKDRVPEFQDAMAREPTAARIREALDRIVEREKAPLGEGVR
jgi:hypothetical protein